MEEPALNCVLQAKRIQNPYTYRLYDVMKKSVARKLNKQEHEVETAPLWHGTSEASIPKITNTKFDRGFSGTSSGMSYSPNLYI